MFAYFFQFGIYCLKYFNLVFLCRNIFGFSPIDKYVDDKYTYLSIY